MLDLASPQPKVEPPIRIVKSYLGFYAQELRAQVTHSALWRTENQSLFRALEGSQVLNNRPDILRGWPRSMEKSTLATPQSPPDADKTAIA
jgi:hypothetical protein